ncbi:hypothetical protein Val02_75940 [Virgisporangium aliadipatigenens]|uniref:Putative glutamate--cysteine ligase 2 n=1 Tax=Virgisporangium aliadipatigenens TaxID=741659 RepID=A0A8J3YVZ3_9ACTN|nr:carboxylate--amine ligase/circularly permuted type 2 ATP-grasp protein [Virgisporangium aliadipatigenens]GIJ50708.1 hypothetical protein Val02_75940 [Virgisporangium aliadipatigenens]
MTESRLLTVGVEEEFHVVDRQTRELVPRAAEILERLPAESYAAEMQRSVVESNSAVCTSLDELRADLNGLRQRAFEVTDPAGLGLIAAGTVPLLDAEALWITPTTRYRQMLDDYQLLAREQLICGTHVHVGVPDRAAAVIVAERVTPWLHQLLALSASSPYWMGEDSGYASTRALVWQRWPTAGGTGGVGSAEEHDELVDDLIASGIISDPRMIYFDVRPSAHKPTVELRVPDACPGLDEVVLIAGLFRALVAREFESWERPAPPAPRAPLLRAAMWRAARSGLESDLLDLPSSPKPVPAAVAVRRMVDELRPQLEAAGDWGMVNELLTETLGRGSWASRQRRAYERRGRLADVVDTLLAGTGGDQRTAQVLIGATPTLTGYEGTDDEAFTNGWPRPAYRRVIDVLSGLGPAELRKREQARDEEQRARGVTFSVSGESSVRLFPFDLVPRLVAADEWKSLQAGLIQRARALDAFLRDVYGERHVVRDGVLPAWVVDTAPGLKPTGALMPRTGVRAHVAGMDLVRDHSGWHVLEDNLRVPSGIGYALQNRRLSRSVLPELPVPPGLLDPESAPKLLRQALLDAAPPKAQDAPRLAVLSAGPSDSAWFEHQLLAEEMGVPVVRSTDLLVDDRIVYLHKGGSRKRIDVLYLRVDEDHLLHAPGADGAPLGQALLAAGWAGTVTLANALGNGVGDDKAIYAYVDRFIGYYLGEQPLLNSVPTYLCGVPEQRAEVLDRLDQLVCKPVDGYGGDRVVIGPSADEPELHALRQQIQAAPHRWIAQEVVRLSTTPVFDGSRLVPRHVDLRAFVFQGSEAVVAPAALTRVAPANSMIVNSSRGGGSKDTWLTG